MQVFCLGCSVCFSQVGQASGRISFRILLTRILAGLSVMQLRGFENGSRGYRGLGRYMQHYMQATLPDASLLLRGVDGATSSLLSSHPMIGFRVNAFRHQLAIDYNPTVSSVVQLARLIQAECEAASITSETGSDKRTRTAALATHTKEPPPPKSVPTPPPPPTVTVAASAVDKGEGKGKGKGKGG